VNLPVNALEPSAQLHSLVAGEPLSSALTPAVLIDTEVVRRNIATTLTYLGSPQRWRPHVKTARLRWTVDALLGEGITRFKASTLSEVALLLDAGAPDILLAYPAIGPTQWRLARLAAEHPESRVSTLVDHPDALRDWRPGPVAAFLDIDPGGGRTGFLPGDAPRALAILAELRRRGIPFRGLHAYDGHLADLPQDEQQAAVAAGLHDLTVLAGRLEAAGHPVGEIVAGGSHTFIPGARIELPDPWGARLTFGPGTVVYNDLRSLGRFGAGGADAGYRCAAFVLTRVVSRQGERGITVDAGLTTIQLDGGRPHAHVIGLAAQVGAPSQEHLKITVDPGPGPVPGYGDPILLVPRHLDTTLAQFDRVYLVEGAAVRAAETVVRPF
jgi:D-serine deaminase-like pyridoxal phosphate-dependent protein